MELKPYKKLTGLEYNLSRTVNYTNEWIQQLAGNDFLRGRYLTDDDGNQNIDIISSPAIINHKLGVTPKGFIVTDKDQNVDVYRMAWDETTITLAFSGAVVVKIWVF